MAMTSGAEAPLPILERLEDISAAWLEAALGKSVIGDASVASFELEAIGAGNASDTRRLVISYDGETENAPASLICKFHPSGEEARINASALQTFEREIGSYSILSKSNACRIPKPYLLAHDADHLNLITEDLSQTARPGNQLAGCSVQDAEAVIQQMARLHSSYGLHKKEDSPSWLMRMPIMGEMFSGAIMAGATSAPARFGDLLSAQQYSTITQCGELAAAWYELPWQNLTVTHGDLRVDNVLFQKNTLDNQEAVLIDWQMTGLRNPMYDLAYFLSSSLTVEDRREQENRLIDCYLEALGESLTGYDQEQAIVDYRLSMIASLITNLIATVALPHTPAANELILILLKRGTDAVEDWDSAAAIRSAAKTLNS